MNEARDKEKDAILRMMVYLKYELLRNSFESEANLISKAIDSFEVRIDEDAKY